MIVLILLLIVLIIVCLAKISRSATPERWGLVGLVAAFLIGMCWGAL